MGVKLFLFCCFFFLGYIGPMIKVQANCENEDVDSCYYILMKDGKSKTTGTLIDGAQLKDRLSKFEDNDTMTLKLMNAGGLTSLPAQVFGSRKFVNVVVINTSLSSIDDNAFQGSEDILENLKLNKNKFTTFNLNSLLAKLKKLEKFELINDNLADVSQDAFFDLPNLKKIDLTSNSIASIKNNAFHKLPSLKLVDLTGNKLTTIGEIFQLGNTTTDLTVNLSSNLISEINQNAFKGVNVSHLNLENNKLKTLAKNVFKPLFDTWANANASTMIDLTGNPGKCKDSSNCWFLENATYKSKFVNFKCDDMSKEMDKLTDSEVKQICQAASTMSLFRYEALVLISFLVLLFNSKISQFES